MPTDSLLFETLGLAALLFLSGFFSMSETALVSADRIQIRTQAEAGDRRARRLEHLLHEPERILTTILLGNNLVNIAATALATLIAVGLFGSTGAAIATGAMTFLILVFAEITPKTLAVRKALPIALRVAAPLGWTNRILRPFVVLLAGISRILLRLVGVKAVSRTPFITQAQIAMLVRMGVEEGEVEQFEQQVINEVFDFTETAVERVMTPRDRVHYLDKSATLQDALELSARTGHSRLPVVDGDFDHVLGFVHAKDLLRFADEDLRATPVTQVLRAVLFAQHDTQSDRVLLRMQREHKLLAVIQDAEGHNSGIATVEDLLEELVGEIHDEFDKPVHSTSPRTLGTDPATDPDRPPA